MPDNVSPDQIKHVVNLLIQCGVLNADQASKAIQNLGNTLQNTDDKMSKWQANLQITNARLQTLGSGIAKIGSLFGAESLGLTNAIGLQYKYNQAIASSYNQMQKFGMSVKEYQGKIDSLRNTYKGTYEQTVQLATAFQKGFSFTGPEKMEGILKSISDVVGPATEDMQNFLGEIQGLASANPLFEKMINNFDTDLIAERGKDIKAFALDMALAGKLSDQQVNALQAFVNGKPGDSDSQARLDSLNKQNLAIRNMRNNFEDINLTLGKQIMPFLQKASEWLGSSNTIVVGLGAGFVLISSVLGGITSSLVAQAALLSRIKYLQAISGGGAGGALAGAAGTAGVGAGAAAAGGAAAGRLGKYAAAGGTTLRGAGGAGVGYLAGGLVDSAFESSTDGRRIGDGSHFWSEAGGGVGRAGSRIGAGFLVGGVPGAIGGGVYSIGSDVWEMKDTAYQTGQAMGGTYRNNSRYDERGKEAENLANSPLRKEIEKQRALVGRLGGGERTDADRNGTSELAKEQAKLQILVAQLKTTKEYSDNMQAIVDSQNESMAKAEAIKVVNEKTAQFLIDVNQEMKTYNQQSEIALARTTAANNLLQARAELVGMSGGDNVSKENKYANERLSIEQSLNEEMIKRMQLLQERGTTQFGAKKNITSTQELEAAKIRDNALDSLSNSTDPDAYGEEYANIMKTYFDTVGYSAGFANAKIDELKAKSAGYWKIEVRNNEIQAKINQPRIDTIEKEIGLREAQVALADSAGMGLKAQVGARKEVLQLINQEIPLVDQQISNFQALAQAAREEAQNSTGQKKEEAQAKERQYINQILEQEQKRTGLIQKQADISKTMREGWIGAISAMTTGAGVFSRITIDQSKRLGNLQFAAPDRIKTLAGGGLRGGRRESAQWTPGGFREGEAGDYEKGVLGQYGLNSSSSLQGMAASVMNYQQNVGSKMSPAAATFGVGPQGTSEVTDAIKEGFKSVGESGPNKKFIIEEKEMQDIKKTFIEAFVKIGKEIEAETIKRISSGR